MEKLERYILAVPCNFSLPFNWVFQISSYQKWISSWLRLIFAVSLASHSIYCHIFLCSLYRKSGWESISGESHLSALLRGEVLLALSTFGHDNTHKEAIRRFQAFVDDRNTPLLSADTKRVIVCPQYLNHFLIPRSPSEVEMLYCMLCRLLTLL